MNALKNQVLISQAFKYNPSKKKKPPSPKKYTAIWDTGATHSAITIKVVNDCNLKMIGMTKTHTIKGIKDSNVYLVNVFLPNRILIPELRVTEGDIYGAEVLIGMDIINQGDFAVTNFNGRTAFSFRMPSVEQLDFVTQRPHSSTSIDLASLPEVGRNDPCPCGSGKKYKHCHGK